MNKNPKNPLKNSMTNPTGTPPPEQLAQELIEPSERFERFSPTRYGNPISALELLGGLGEITRKSFATLQGEAKAKELAAQLAQPVQRPQPPAAPVYESARPEYRPALKNPEVVDALLAFHRQNRAYDPKFPIAPAPTAAAAAPAPTPQSEAPFAPLAVERVDQVAVKSNSFRSKPRGVTQPILRPSGRS